MQSIAEKFVSAQQAAYDNLVTECGNTTLSLIRANTDTQFAARVSGLSNQPYMKYFTAQDFAGVHAVEVIRQSPVLNNIAGRFEVFDRVSKLPKADRRAAIMLLKTGDDSAYTDQDMSSQVLIFKENELLSTGNPSVMQYVVASPVDDHILHCRDHVAALNRLRAMDPPPGAPPQPGMPPQPGSPYATWQLAQKMLIQHINDHSIAWMKTNPVFAAVCSIPPPPMFDAAGGGFVPQAMGTPESAPSPDPGGGPGPGQMQAAPALPPGPEETDEPPGQDSAGGKKNGAAPKPSSKPAAQPKGEAS